MLPRLRTLQSTHPLPSPSPDIPILLPHMLGWINHNAIQIGAHIIEPVPKTPDCDAIVAAFFEIHFERRGQDYAFMCVALVERVERAVVAVDEDGGDAAEAPVAAYAVRGTARYRTSAHARTS